jgi:APA family basic amino acid/polyamine antiporter
VAIVACTLGCLASTILYASRAYVGMAADGSFFASMGRIHPRYRTPTVALWAQAVWSIALAWSGSYAQLYTFVTFAGRALSRRTHRTPAAAEIALFPLMS